MRKIVALLLSVMMSLGIFTSAFAGTGDAYLFGMEKSGDIKASKEMNYIADILDLNGYYTRVYENPITSRFTDSRLNSTVLYLAGQTIL